LRIHLGGHSSDNARFILNCIQDFEVILMAIKTMILEKNEESYLEGFASYYEDDDYVFSSLIPVG